MALKHHIIEKELAKVQTFVIYSDAGSSFNYRGVERFNEYIEMLNSSNYGTFRIEGLEQHKENIIQKEILIFLIQIHSIKLVKLHNIWVDI